MAKKRNVEPTPSEDKGFFMLMLAGIGIVFLISAVVVFLRRNDYSAATPTPTFPPISKATYTPVIPIKPTLAPAAQFGVRSVQSPIPPSAVKGSTAWGVDNAPFNVEVYSDYQCANCAQSALINDPEIIRLFASSGKVRYSVNSVAFIEQNVNGRESRDAAQSALCAAEQDSFWKMHYALYTNLNGENVGSFSRDRLKVIAQDTGLNAAVFNTCLDSNKYEAMVLAAKDQSIKRNVEGVPATIINGKVYSGSFTASQLRDIFKELRPDIKFE